MTTGSSIPWAGDPAITSSGRRFRLIEIVGRGVFGDVYLAEQQSGAGFRRKVVLKILNDEVARRRNVARRMRDEARVLGLQSHRHIVSVHDLVQIGDRWAILMDWVPGADLEHVLEALRTVRGVFPPSAALEVGAAIFDALDFASNATDGRGSQLTIVHRDIKPSNVRLTPDGDVKVLDFGIARFSYDAREAETRTSAWIGTERYMSPERLLRESETFAGDVYAAASTVVELILGEPMGRSPITADAHHAWVDAALARIRPRIDAETHVVGRVMTALSRALRADPALRPEARELSRELESLSRRVRGPSLKAFARELVPRVDVLLGSGPTPVSGSWIERTDSNDPAPSIASSSDSELADPFFDAPVEAAILPPRPRRQGGWFATLLAANVAVFCSLGALFLVAAATLGDEIWGWMPPIGLPEAIGMVAGADLAEVAPTLSVPSLSGAAVRFPDATALVIRCGEVSARGTSSARLDAFPIGSCTVSATWLGETRQIELHLDGQHDVRCAVTDGALGCAEVP